MSDTPRTDAAIRDFGYRDEVGQWIKQDAIDTSFARQLERELNQARAELDGLLEQLGSLKGKENRYRNLYESAESKLASLTQENEQLRAGYANTVQVLEKHRRFHSKVGCPGKECYVCDAEEALSSTPQSVKDVMDVLEAAKRLTEPDPEDDDLIALKDAVRTWTGGGE